MGCGASKPVEGQRPVPEPKKGWEEGSKVVIGESRISVDVEPWNGSARPKSTTDSGVGLEERVLMESLPGTIPENSLSLDERNEEVNTEPVISGLINTSQHLQSQERLKSSDILEELIIQGIIQSQSKVFRNGESYNVMMNMDEKPLRKPPARLEKLKTKRETNGFTIKNIEEKMKAADERRKVKGEEMKKRLRSDRPLPPIVPSSTAELSEDDTPFTKGFKTTDYTMFQTSTMETERQAKRKKSFGKGNIVSSEINQNYEGFGVVESDVHYNTSDDAF
ncbi:stathmin domain-containing protein 1 [Monodelphis domestica]|uniref:Stathmin domain containing 1 n=1 Tax=Monodelphis domestica TaxID=13616 RepID=F7FJG2_MONDO|nr:stathmin domain-containing protein 1 [Monodelphis domestica]